MAEENNPLFGARMLYVTLSPVSLDELPPKMSLRLVYMLGSVGLFTAERTTHSRAGAGRGHDTSPAHSWYHLLSSSQEPLEWAS